MTWDRLMRPAVAALALLAGSAAPALAAPAAVIAAVGAAADPEVCHSEVAAAPSASPSQTPGAPQAFSVRLPEVALRVVQGERVGERQALGQRVRTEDAALLNFIFTSCTSVCPPMSAVFAATQQQLGARAGEVQMISVSIDPEHDTPGRLHDYAARFGAGAQWSFHTGAPAAIDAVQRAFSVYRPDKMGHTPVTFVKPRGRDGWLRVDGFATPQQLLALALPEAKR
ncbi:MAG: SCO family protein [Leptothrix sp. (in: b-proteobacteria)]